MVSGYVAISLSFQQSIANTYLLYYSMIMDAKTTKWCYLIVTIIPALVLLSLHIEVVVNIDLKSLQKVQVSEIVLQSIIISSNVILYLVCVFDTEENWSCISRNSDLKR